MADVLETLRKLPPVCAVWLEGESRGVLVKRGVMGFCDLPLATMQAVQNFNARRNVTTEQVGAMMSGATLGWDSEGADIPGSQKTFIYEASFRLLMSVTADSEEAAAKQAHDTVDRVSSWVETQDLGENVLCLAKDADEIDLIENE